MKKERILKNIVLWVCMATLISASTFPSLAASLDQIEILNPEALTEEEISALSQGLAMVPDDVFSYYSMKGGTLEYVGTRTLLDTHSVEGYFWIMGNPMIVSCTVDWYGNRMSTSRLTTIMLHEMGHFVYHYSFKAWDEETMPASLCAAKAAYMMRHTPVEAEERYSDIIDTEYFARIYAAYYDGDMSEVEAATYEPLIKTAENIIAQKLR